jgi:hypothetical protein
MWRFPIIGNTGGPGGLVLSFGCKKSLNKRYVKVKRRKTSIVIDVEDMSYLSTMDVLICIKDYN